MVLLVERLHKLYSKLENHHHQSHHEHQEEVLQASLLAFRSEVSSCITKLLLNCKPGFGSLSLTWIRECFKLLPMINKAFAKLVLEIDYPMSKWGAKSREEYLNYSLKLLDLLNLISSSISRMCQARLCLSHALSLVEDSPCSAMERLKPIGMEMKNLCKEFKDREKKEEEKGGSCMDKEGVISQALTEVKSMGFLVCCVALAGLNGDAKVYLEMGKLGTLLCNSLMVNLDSAICGVLMENGCELEEAREVNEAVVRLAAALEAGESCSGAVEEMERRLKGFEKLLDDLGMEVESLFSEVLAARSKLLDGIRFRKK